MYGNGTCEHYVRVDYVLHNCPKCYMDFLRCPICKPYYCPDCRVAPRVTPVEIPYCIAKAKSLARVKAWKNRQKLT